MNEEEKKAIKWLENTELTSYPNDINAIETVLKLVYKQQKEIEELKDEIKELLKIFI